MSINEEIDRDLRGYLIKADNLRNEDRLALLKTIFHKHLELNKMDYVISSGDLFLILSDAKSEFGKLPSNPEISSRPVPKGELVAISVIEAFVTFLNRNDMLKRMPMIDYTDSSNEYEELV